MKKGNFYKTKKPPTLTYFCEAVTKDEATITLIESKHPGGMVYATMRMELKFADQYTEVTEQKEVARLQAIYDKFKADIASGRLKLAKPKSK